MRDAQRSFDHDAVHATPEMRNQRARFGVYFYSTPMQNPLENKDQKNAHEPQS